MDYHIFTTFIIILLGLFFSLGKSRNSLRIRKTYLFISTILLVLESGLRGLYVGDDTLNYFNSFESVKNTSFAELFQGLNFLSNTDYSNRNNGYNLFQKIFQILSDDYRVYLFFIAIMFFLSLYYFLLRNTLRLIELILALTLYSVLFYYFFSITGIKQTITTSVALYVSKYILEKKMWRFIIPILIASLVHVSVLIFLPFYFIAGLKNVKRNFIIALFSFIIIFILKDVVFLFLIRGTVYEIYSDDISGLGTVVFTSLIALIVFISFITIDRMAKIYSNYYFYFNAILIAFMLVPLTWVNSNSMRVVQYFSIYLLVFIPKIIETIGFKNTSLKKLGYRTCIILLIFLLLKTPSTYEFFWE